MAAPRTSRLVVLEALAVAKNQDEALETLNKLKPSKEIIRALYRLFRDNGKPTALVELYATQCGWSVTLETGGRAQPSEGIARHYRVQQLDSSGTYIQLPTTSLPVKKGDKVLVRFDKGSITVSALPGTVKDEG